MLTAIVCGKCRKQYRVDAKFAGKKVRCKACSHEIAVPIFESLEAAAYAADAEYPPPPPKPAADTPFCPNCGEHLVVLAGACRACGRRIAGQDGLPLSSAPVPAPVVSRPAPRFAAPKPRNDYDHDALGTRINRPYDNPILSFFEGAGVVVAQILYWLSIFALGVLSALSLRQLVKYGGDRVPFKVYALVILETPAAFLLTYYIMLPLQAAGVALAGRVMRFEVPENTRWRALAAWELASAIAMVAYFIMAVFAVVAGSAGHQDAAGGIMILTSLVMCVVMIPLHFFLVKFFFRLLFTEAIVAYLFQFMIMLGLMAVMQIALILYLWVS